MFDSLLHLRYTCGQMVYNTREILPTGSISKEQGDKLKTFKTRKIDV